MMYLLIIMGIYHLLRIILRKEGTNEAMPESHAAHEDSRHPAEIQLR